MSLYNNQTVALPKYMQYWLQKCHYQANSVNRKLNENKQVFIYVFQFEVRLNLTSHNNSFSCLQYALRISYSTNIFTTIGFKIYILAISLLLHWCKWCEIFQSNAHTQISPTPKKSRPTLNYMCTHHLCYIVKL